MKILICGSTDVWAIENYYCKHLNKQGSETTIFPAGNIFRENYSTLFDKIKHKINPKILYNKINRELLETVRLLKPNVVLVFKGMEIYPETIRQLNSEHIFTVNYNADHPFMHTNKGAGNNNVKNSIPNYKLHLSYSNLISDQLTRQYKVSCKIIPFGFDHENIDYGYLPEKEIQKVAFVGNPDTHRVTILNALSTSGIPIDIYGNNWSQYNLDKHISIFPPIYGKEFWTILQKYRIQLNIFRPHNENSHNMRTFEVPSVGGIMIAPSSAEHFSFFEYQKEAFFYNSIYELETICFNLLNMSYEDAVKIRKAAYNRSQKSGYAYSDRSRQALDILIEQTDQTCQ